MGELELVKVVLHPLALPHHVRLVLYDLGHRHKVKLRPKENMTYHHKINQKSLIKIELLRAPDSATIFLESSVKIITIS